MKKTIALAFALFIAVSAVCYPVTWDELCRKAQSMYSAYDNEVKDILMKQEITVYIGKKKNITQTTVMRKGDRYRTESVSTSVEGGQPVKTVMVGNSSEAWVVLPMVGKKRIETKEGSLQSKHDWWKMGLKNARITGTEKIDGRVSYVVEFEKGGKKETPFTKMWIDVKTCSVIRYETAGPDKEITQAKFSDFRKINNKWEYPFRQDIYKGKQLVTHSVVKEFKTGQKLPDDLFNPDKLEDKGARPGTGDIGGIM